MKHSHIEKGESGAPCAKTFLVWGGKVGGPGWDNGQTWISLHFEVVSRKVREWVG